jgi:hypothetical protein
VSDETAAAEPTTSEDSADGSEAPAADAGDVAASASEDGTGAEAPVAEDPA